MRPSAQGYSPLVRPFPAGPRLPIVLAALVVLGVLELAVSGETLKTVLFVLVGLAAIVAVAVLAGDPVPVADESLRRRLTTAQVAAFALAIVVGALGPDDLYALTTAAALLVFTVLGRLVVGALDRGHGAPA